MKLWAVVTFLGLALLGCGTQTPTPTDGSWTSQEAFLKGYWRVSESTDSNGDRHAGDNRALWYLHDGHYDYFSRGTWTKDTQYLSKGTTLQFTSKGKTLDFAFEKVTDKPELSGFDAFRLKGPSKVEFVLYRTNQDMVDIILKAVPLKASDFQDPFESQSFIR